MDWEILVNRIRELVNPMIKANVKAAIAEAHDFTGMPATLKARSEANDAEDLFMKGMLELIEEVRRETIGVPEA